MQNETYNNSATIPAEFKDKDLLEMVLQCHKDLLECDEDKELIIEKRIKFLEKECEKRQVFVTDEDLFKLYSNFLSIN